MAMDTRKVVLITGCSEGGIGWALAKDLAERTGYRVFAAARTPNKTGDLAARGCEIVALDVLDTESVSACIESVYNETGGRIDILVNNAGIIELGPFLDMREDVFERIVSTNFFGMARVARAVLPGMVERSRGTIVNIGSALSGVSQPFSAAYAASKAATRSWTESLAQEVAMLGVKVLLVEPGIIATHLFAREQPWQPREGSLYAGVAPAQKHIRFMQDLMVPGKNYPVDTFARRTVDNILATRPRFFDNTMGRMATAWWFLECLPRWLRYPLERMVTGLHGDYRKSEVKGSL